MTVSQLVFTHHVMHIKLGLEFKENHQSLFDCNHHLEMF